jgi:hypothetical protein
MSLSSSEALTGLAEPAAAGVSFDFFSLLELLLAFCFEEALREFPDAFLEADVSPRLSSFSPVSYWASSSSTLFCNGEKGLLV